ncbi:MAG: 3-dehydro-L-gulonate 2-dehydrogenase [Fusobacteriaceae bacterium]
MRRVKFEELEKEFKRILLKKGCDEDIASKVAKLYTETSCDGVYSHGVNRFPRTIEYIDKGYIDMNAVPTMECSVGALERWNGNLGFGNLNAQIAMDRAIELSKKYGIGCVAIKNTNHWLRGGTFGWQAAKAGCIGICWTNTQPNMPAWGAKERRIGNNPIIFSVPKKSGAVVVDVAVAQFSYGQMENTKLRGELLPVPGGYDINGKLSNDPVEIEKTWRVLPIGFWKGSGLSIMLDLIASVLSDGNSCEKVGELGGDEYALSQVLIAINTEKMSDISRVEEIVNSTIDYVKKSEPVEKNGEVFYPGERSLVKRKENLELGIPVDEVIWNKLKSL